VTVGQLRQPRGAVKINGVEVPGWISFDTDANEFSSPDTFRVSFAMSALPKDHSTAWWASQVAAIFVELFAGFPADPDHYSSSELTSVFYGQVDDLDFDFDDLTLHASGRDLTAALTDNKTSEKYINQTASQVAGKLAAKYGLTASITATTKRVGVEYAADHVDLKSQKTEWQLLTFLAEKESFRVFVKGRVLHFEPIPASVATTFVLQKATGGDGPDAWNGQTVKISRTLTVARDISVTVISWHGKKKLQFKRTATLPKKGSGQVQTVVRTFPNLTPEEAQRRAQQILSEMSKHEVKLAFTGPADSILAIDGAIQVKGTGTVLDQTFFPASIARTMTFDGGYGWTVEAKNHSPESQVSL
jgi:phage protein D